MKKVFLFLVVMCMSTVGLADLPNLDDMDIRDQIDVRSFLAGNDSDVGDLYYIIDRSTGMCFAQMWRGNGGVGINLIDCKNLKKIPIMKQYIETGSVETP